MKKIINKKPKTISIFKIFFKNEIINEGSKYRGISHLLEHLMCKPVKLIPEFTKYGIVSNAYTTSSYIVFYIKGLDKYVNMYKDIFLECILSFDGITEETFETEKRIVLEEYKDSFSDESSEIAYNLLRKHFNFYCAIGEKTSLENITWEETKKFYYDKQLNLPSFIYNVSYEKFTTDIPFRKKEEKLKSSLLKQQDGYILENISTNTLEKRYTYHISPKLVNNQDYPKLRVLCDILGCNLNSYLYKKIREENGISYSLMLNIIPITSKDSVFCITVPLNSKKESLETYNKIIEDLLSNYKDIITKEIYEETMLGFKVELEKQKMYPETININKSRGLDKVIKVTYQDTLEVFEKLMFDMIYYDNTDYLI